LPKDIGLTGKLWLAGFAVAIAWAVVSIHNASVRRAVDRIDTSILRQVVRLRTGWLTTVVKDFDRIMTGWTASILALAMVVVLMVLRRWRHLFVLLGALTVFDQIGVTLYKLAARPRPYGVEIIGRWAGFSLPAPDVAVCTSFLIGAVYTLVVPGRPRTMAKWVVAGLVVVLSFCRLYLGVDHLSDIVIGVAGASVLIAAFRMFTPNEVFPVTYRKGKTAHLDVTGRRGDAIRAAVQDQLGLTVVDIKPVGLEGSGGSTPLRLKVTGDPDTYLFGKLYAMSHVRADRWYKFGRTIMYGRLEDEAPFQSVRRFVEYEDYTIRLLADAGIATAKAFGIVEITPQREYMLVTEFIDGSKEISEADIDDGVIDEGLTIVRRLWDAGLAHRDIKPANLLVRDGRVYLIDAFFVQVRPSPWRQAVDLANMMLVLAVRTDPERIYQRALNYFTPDEIAEAFAATRGVASPTQLRTAMKRDGRDLLNAFRALAPPRELVALQRWSFRRVLVAVAALVIGLIFVSSLRATIQPAGEVVIPYVPHCTDNSVLVLIAQSAPSATIVPCVSSLPAGWSFGGVRIQRDRTRMWLDGDIAGKHAVEAEMRPPSKCDVGGATRVPSDEPSTTRFERIDHLPPGMTGTRVYLFEGGCVMYHFRFSDEASPATVFEVDAALGFRARSVLVDYVRRVGDAKLCGAGVGCRG
jgi:tRNA A-37 threonylcarbamoyl transferase component Bud32